MAMQNGYTVRKLELEKDRSAIQHICSGVCECFFTIMTHFDSTASLACMGLNLCLKLRTPFSNFDTAVQLMLLTHCVAGPFKALGFWHALQMMAMTTCQHAWNIW